eukprot:scaffold68_cov340-Pavlova_lutheri.AAC.21
MGRPLPSRSVPSREESGDRGPSRKGVQLHPSGATPPTSPRIHRRSVEVHAPTPTHPHKPTAGDPPPRDPRRKNSPGGASNGRLRRKAEATSSGRSHRSKAPSIRHLETSIVGMNARES